MITLTATLELDNENSTLENATSNVKGNNISSPIDSVLNKKTENANPFLLGVSTLGSGGTLQENVPFYISSEISKSDGIFDTSFAIDIQGSNISAVTIIFDKQNNTYPKTISVNGEQRKNSANSVQIVTEPYPYLSIGIPNLNKSNHPLIIQGIYINLSYNLDSRNLQNLDFKRTTKSQIEMPSFGIISNQGNVEFIDRDNTIGDFIEKNIINQKLSVTIYLNNTICNCSQQVAKTYTYNWSYDNDGRLVNVKLKDDLEEWQNIFIDGINYDPTVLQAQPFSEIYKELHLKTPSKFNMMPFDNLDEKTKNVLNNTFCFYPIIKSGSLWSCWQKLCVVCQLYIYKNSNDETVCSYLLGV